MNKRLGVVLLLLFAWTPAWAATRYYVSTTGSDSNNCLTTGAACATFQHAHDIASCGDTITGLAGQYYERAILTKACTAALPLTITGIRGEGATWDTKIEGTDAATDWVDATAQCTGCFRIANPGYVPWALIAHTNRLTVMRIHDNQMNGNVCSGCLGTGFNTLSRDAANTVVRTVGTLLFWDGIEALWGEEAGFTYLKFRNAEDPDTIGSIRVSPDAATFRLNGAAHIVLQHMQIAGGRFGVHVANSSDNISILSNDIRNGENGIRVETGCDDVIIKHNTMNPRFIGSTAGYAATVYLPRDWNDDNIEGQNANNIYMTNKFEVGNTLEGSAPVDIRSGATDTRIEHNTIQNVVVGVNLLNATGIIVRDNSIHHCAGECIFALDRFQSATIDANNIYEGDHLIRIQLMGWAKTLTITRNRFYQEGEGAKHVHFSFSSDVGPGETDSPAVIWLAHNTFAGSGWAMDLGGSGVETIPCVRMLNNVVSVTGAAGTKGVSSLGLNTKVGLFAYNHLQEVGAVGVTTGATGQGCTAAVEGDAFTGTAIWTTPPQPTFILPGGHAALNTALPAHQPFALGGITYLGLANITTAYYRDGVPDIGAPQGGQPVRIATSPPKRTPVTEVCGDRLDNNYNGTVDEGC